MCLRWLRLVVAWYVVTKRALVVAFKHNQPSILSEYLMTSMASWLSLYSPPYANRFSPFPDGTFSRCKAKFYKTRRNEEKLKFTSRMSIFFPLLQFINIYLRFMKRISSKSNFQPCTPWRIAWQHPQVQAFLRSDPSRYQTEKSYLPK